jgi:hypothetical protein
MPDAPAPPDYLVKFETLSLGGLDYRIRSLLDRQQFSDPDGAAERAGICSASWPLFGLRGMKGLGYVHDEQRADSQLLGGGFS